MRAISKIYVAVQDLVTFHYLCFNECIPIWGVAAKLLFFQSILSENWTHAGKSGGQANQRAVVPPHG